MHVISWVMHCRTVIAMSQYLKLLDYGAIDVLLAKSGRINVYRVCHELLRIETSEVYQQQ